MSFGVSLNGGELEYSSVGASAFLCNGRNLLKPRFWSMTLDLLRFYKRAPREVLDTQDEMVSLGEYLQRQGYGAPFQDDHLLPQAAAIWSASLAEIRQYPACAFVRFFENHGLLKLNGRPDWRTVTGGSRAYVDKLSAAFASRVNFDAGVAALARDGSGVWVRTERGDSQHYDAVVIAAHADEALKMLDDPSNEERALLGACAYTKNRAVLHTDRALMPRREPLWASWNYVAEDPAGGCVVTYWMNKLQNLRCDEQLFLTLNPQTMPRADAILYQTEYEHPVFDANAIRAQERLWSLQGVRNTWFCGAYFGAGFHEDAVQAGLAVGEQLGGLRRPWRVEEESCRIRLPAPASLSAP